MFRQHDWTATASRLRDYGSRFREEQSNESQQEIWRAAKGKASEMWIRQSECLPCSHTHDDVHWHSIAPLNEASVSAVVCRTPICRC